MGIRTIVAWALFVIFGLLAFTPGVGKYVIAVGLVGLLVISAFIVVRMRDIPLTEASKQQYIRQHNAQAEIERAKIARQEAAQQAEITHVEVRDLVPEDRDLAPADVEES